MIVERAKKAEAVAKKQIDQQQDMLAIVDKAVGEGEALLNSTRQQQQKLDELMADADRHRETAASAAAMAKDVVDEAHKTLETLRNFDTEVESSKGDADAAVAKFPEVERLLEEAEAKLEEVKAGEMGEAGEEADKALEMLEEAKAEADKVANETSTLLDLADSAAAAALQADQLQLRVMQEDARLQKLENSTQDFVDKADEALQIAESTADVEDNYRRKAESALR